MSDTCSHMQLIHMYEGGGYFPSTTVWPLLRGNYEGECGEALAVLYYDEVYEVSHTQSDASC